MSDGEVPSAEWLLEARTIKHQMSNILMGILGHAELLEEQPDLPGPSRKKVLVIREHVRRLQEQLDALNELCRTGHRY